jgi:hypothetical protein
VVGRQLRPGSRPFVRHLNPPGADEANLSLVSRFMLEAEGRGRILKDRRGLVALDEVSLLECANLLDGLRYADHGRVRFESDRWRALEQQAHISTGDHEFPLYRAPDVGAAGVDLGARSPYVIAAYLRFWAACLDRHVRGVLTDEAPPQRWSLLNLDAKRASQPRFRIGVRFGGGAPVTSGPLADLSAALNLQIQPMARKSTEGELAADWGSRKATEAGYVGDDLFDVSLLHETPSVYPDGTRTEGSPGLVLFHLIERPEDGRGAIGVGLSIPAGGPDHLEAVSTLRKRGTSEHDA